MQINEAHQKAMWDAVEGIANGDPGQSSEHLADLKGILNVGTDTSEGAQEGWECVLSTPEVDVSALNANGMRPIDVLARGRDSEDACFATLFLVQAGADMNEQPTPSDGPPAHVAAYNGNWQVLGTLVDLGADAGQKVTATRQGLFGGNAIHALATGFRAAREEDFGQCFAALLSAGVDINARDRRRQVPIDIAMRSAANTDKNSLVDAMLNYGVDLTNRASSASSASSLASAVTRRTGDAILIAQMSKCVMANIYKMNTAKRALEAIEESSSPAATPSL